MKVSVIIPIYNVEKFLNRCIESVINQEYQNLEIILVDDGSPDNCPHLCDEWANKDSRISVIHKTNGGLSDARNAGLEIATGDFVTFLDSDDYFLKNFSQCCKILEQNQDQDVLCFGRNNDKYKNIYYSICACMKFFNLKFLRDKQINFMKGIYHEDVPFSLEILINTKKILSFKECFYYYDTLNETSITREKNAQKYFKRFADIYKSLDIVNSKYGNILSNKDFIKFLSRTTFDSIKLAKFMDLNENYEFVVKTIVKNKKYFKYPKSLENVLIKTFMTLFGVKKTINFINKLGK